MQNAAKVGVLVVIFIGLLVGAYAVIGRSLFKKVGATYFAEFPDAGGVKAGTSVQMAGVKVGQVTEVALVSPTLARLTLEIEPEVKIPEGSTAAIPTALIGLGDNPVQIVPPAQLASASLPPGSTLPGTKLGALDNILPNTGETMQEVNKTLAATRRLIEDQKVLEKMEKLLDTSNETLIQFGKIGNRVDTVIAQSNPQIQQALKDATLTVAEVRKGTEMITELIREGKFQRESLALLEKMNQAAAGANQVLDDIHAYLADPDIKTNIKATTQSVATIADSGTRIAASGERIATTGEAIAENAKTLSEKANKLADQASELLEEVRKAVGSVSGILKPGGGGPRLPRIATTMDLMRETDPGRFRTDFGLEVGLGENNLHLGLYDAFETNKLNLQLGKSFDGGQYRYGVYASKPGVGVDFQVAPRLTFRGDLFDLNNPQLDLRARYDFGNGFYGWFGVDKVFDKNSATIGIGIRR